MYDVFVHSNASVRNNVRLYHVQIGRYSYVSRNSLIQNTEIGCFCSIADNCNIGLPSHPLDFVSTSPVFLNTSNYLNKNFAKFEYNDCPTTYIGNDVWIGSGAKIKSGVKVGNGSVIAAGAIVTKDVPAYAIVAGIPARIIRFRFNEKNIES